MFLVSAILTLAATTSAREGWAITRPVNNPNQVPGIQACLNASRPGDVVLVGWNQNPYVGNFVVPAGVSLKASPGFQGRPMLRPADASKPVVDLHTDAAVGRASQLLQFDIQGGANSGVFVSGNGAAVVWNNEIANNQAAKGAGVCSSCSGRMDITFNYIHDNVAANYGGGLFLTGGGTVVSAENEIKCNRASRGGGIEVRGALTCSFSEHVFMENDAGEGGGIALVDNPRTARISNMDFFDNDATVGNGGTIYALRSAVVVENCLIDGGNCPRDGGGLYGLGSTVTLSGCDLHFNTALDGAGVALSGRLNANSAIEGNEFLENRATYRGGAVWLANLARMNVRNNFFDRNLAPQGCGVFVVSGATASIYNNTFAHALNAAIATEAVRVQGLNNPTSVANNIIAHHRIGIVGDGGNLAWAGWNDFWQVNAQNQIRGVRNAGGNNANINPMFVVFNANGAGNFDLHLQPGSPSAGTADARYSPPDDIDGDARDSLPDRGADEIVP
jgi:hypothetical protein